MSGRAGLQFVAISDFVQRQVLGDKLCELDGVPALADRGHHQLVIDLVQLVLVWKIKGWMILQFLLCFEVTGTLIGSSAVLTRLHDHYRPGVR